MLYVILVAVVNLLLGFAIAVLLGRGPFFARELLYRVPGQRPLLAEPPMPASPEAGLSDRVAEADVPASPEPPAVQASEPSPPDEPLAEEPAAEEPPSEPQPEREKGEVEGSIDEVMAGLQQFRSQIANLNHKVRQCSENPKSVEIKGCVAEFRNVNQQYLEQTQQAAEHLQGQQENLGELSGVGEQLQHAIDAQTHEVETTTNHLKQLDVEHDPDGSCKKLLDETNQLVESNSRLEENLDSARMEVARSEGWIEQMDAAILTDELTQIASRAAFESALAEFWRKDPHRSRPLTVAMVGIDHIRRLHEQQGLEISDQVVKAVAHIVDAAFPGDELVARYGGQKYLVMFKDDTPRHVVDAVERVRQIVEETNFLHGEEAVEVSVSCALTEVVAEDSTKTLFERLDHTLQEAKRYGRNRTFLHDGKFPAPVVPPNFTIESQTYQL